ncbi:ATP synthase subunit AtpR [Jannaschia rubra]|uniref:ATP synthase subunit AtpR n=1 Tax=Jannaschia rubra TaxID=282197 RepID=UPI0024901E5E|nr:ATP synthase subunit AtpR [Jannaschia rubra]
MTGGIDWTLFAMGALAGAAAAAAFFGGLAVGVRMALRRRRPMAVLLPSAAIRIALLLTFGWWVAGLGAVALAGFALAFMVLRVVLLATVRAGTGGEAKPWN